MGLLQSQCECAEDGYCRRYGREMTGRFREICCGINVDAGTAAVFRSQWSREAVPVDWTDSKYGPPTRLLLKTDQAPGDTVAMTAALYSLHHAHPGKYITAVESYWPDVFLHNPDVYQHLVPSNSNIPLEGFSDLRMHYPEIDRSNDRGIHFMQAWCEFLGSALGVSVPLLTNRPRLYFAYPDERVEDYWVVCSGGKRDFTNKLWGHDNYQQVVSSLKGTVRFIQVGGAKPVVQWSAVTGRTQEDYHQRLHGAEDMRGKTTLRDLFDIVRQARGVLCGVSLLMHVAAALERPAVVVAGGREPTTWNMYPKMRYVHTVGALPCRSLQGHIGQACWRSRVVPLGDGSWHDNNTCERPIDGLPQCMRLITPDYVVSTIMQMEGKNA